MVAGGCRSAASTWNWIRQLPHNGHTGGPVRNVSTLSTGVEHARHVALTVGILFMARTYSRASTSAVADIPKQLARLGQNTSRLCADNCCV